MIYTYTAAAADILYIMLYGFVRVHQMWIEYLQGGGLGLGGGGAEIGDGVSV